MYALLVFVAFAHLIEGNCEFCKAGIANGTLMLPDFLNLPDSLISCASLTTIDTEPLDKFACAGLQAFQNYCCPGDGIYACEFCPISGLDNPETFLQEKNMTCEEYHYRAIFADEEKCNEDFKPMESLCCSPPNEPPSASPIRPTAPPVKAGQCVFCSNGLVNDTLIMPEFLKLPATISSCAKLNDIDTEPLDKFACAGLLTFQNYCCPGDDVFACDFCSSGLTNPEAIVPMWNESCSQFQYRAVFVDEAQCQEDYIPMESLCCPTSSSSPRKNQMQSLVLSFTTLSTLVASVLVYF